MLDMNQVMREHDLLSSQLEDYRDNYYQTFYPSITNNEYDGLLIRAKTLQCLITGSPFTRSRSVWTMDDMVKLLPRMFLNEQSTPHLPNLHINLIPRGVMCRAIYTNGQLSQLIRLDCDTPAVSDITYLATSLENYHVVNNIDRIQWQVLVPNNTNLWLDGYLVVSDDTLNQNETLSQTQLESIHPDIYALSGSWINGYNPYNIPLRFLPVQQCNIHLGNSISDRLTQLRLLGYVEVDDFNLLSSYRQLEELVYTLTRQRDIYYNSYWEPTILYPARDQSTNLALPYTDLQITSTREPITTVEASLNQPVQLTMVREVTKHGRFLKVITDPIYADGVRMEFDVNLKLHPWLDTLEVESMVIVALTPHGLRIVSF